MHESFVSENYLIQDYSQLLYETAKDVKYSCKSLLHCYEILLQI